MTEGPARDDAPDAIGPRASKPGAARPGVARPDGAQSDGDRPDDAEHQENNHEGADREGADAHDQPTRPAYGHLYGVERSLDSFLPLQDVVFAVDEAFLEALRDFAAQALDDMRRLGGDYDHLHFRDVAQVWHESWPDIILVAPRAPAGPDAQPASDDADDASDAGDAAQDADAAPSSDQ